MSTKYHVRTYHGKLPDKVGSVLDQIAVPNPAEGTWEYSGTLDDLHSKLGEVGAMFYALPFSLRYDPTIFVTNHMTWGSR